MLSNRPDFHSPNASSVLLRSYQKAQFWRRLILTAFFAVFAATLFYVVPWLPWGLSVEDYNNRVTLLMVLMLAATGLAFAAVYLRDLSNRVEQTMLTWNTVNDGLGDLRRREYFFDRIVLECSRASLTREPFTVVILRLSIPDGSDNEKISRAIKSLESIVREYDCLSSLGPHEISVLAQSVDNDEAPMLANALAQLVAGAFPEVPAEYRRVTAGYAVHHFDSVDAGTLIGIARERLMRNRQTPASKDEIDAVA